MKHLGINLLKHVEDLYVESFKIQKKETKENLKKQRGILCSWILKVNTFMMSILSNLFLTSINK